MIPVPSNVVLMALLGQGDGTGALWNKSLVELRNAGQVHILKTTSAMPVQYFNYRAGDQRTERLARISPH